MRIGLVIFLLLAVSLVAFAQGKFDANWVFGFNSRIDFSDTAHPKVLPSLCFTEETTASISDSAGRLQLYITAIDTNLFVYSIRDSLGNIIENGDSIFTNTEEFNGAIFVPVPRKPGEYYLFILGTVFLTGGYGQSPMYSHIVYDTTNNQYRVQEKNLFLTNQVVSQGMALVKHGNGIDWWLFVHKDANTWMSFLITSDSIKGPYYQNMGVNHQEGLSCITFSPF